MDLPFLQTTSTVVLFFGRVGGLVVRKFAKTSMSPICHQSNELIND